MTKSSAELILQLRAALDSAGFIQTSAGAGGVTMRLTVEGDNCAIRYGEHGGKLHAALAMTDTYGRKYIDYLFVYAAAVGHSTLELHLGDEQPALVHFPLHKVGARKFDRLVDQLQQIHCGQFPAVTIGPGQTEPPRAANGFICTANADTLCGIAEHIIGGPLPGDRKATLEAALEGMTGAEADPATPRWQLTFEAVMQFLTEAAVPVRLATRERPLAVVKTWWSDRKNHAKR